MKRIMMSLVFGATLLAQGNGRPGNGSNAPYVEDRVGYGNRSTFAERISRGERMGLLTPREAARLWTMERELRSETARAERSGFGMSHRERERLAEMSLRLDREISRELRDGDRAYRSSGRW